MANNSISRSGQTANWIVGNIVAITPATTAATAAVTITPDQTGSIFTFGGVATQAQTITLPAPVAGFSCKFVLSVNLQAFAVLITSVGAGTMQISRMNNATPAIGGVALSTGFAASTDKGATIELYSDGVNYYGIGRTLTANGSITTAA